MENVKFNSRRISREYRQTINAKPDEIFPLLCPVREIEWLDGWQHRDGQHVTALPEQGLRRPVFE